MTSNIGSHELARQARMGFASPKDKNDREEAEQNYEELKSTVLGELKKEMKPELIGRIDQVIVFSPLGLSELKRITELQIKELQTRLAEKSITLTVSKGVRDEIAERAFKDNAGARPIRRIVQELLEDPIANSVVAEEIVEGTAQEMQARKTGKIIKVTAVDQVKARRPEVVAGQNKTNKK